MSITSTRKARIQARITAKETYRDSLYNLQANFDDGGDVESYRFDSGEGSQQTKFRSLSEVDMAIRRVESTIERLYRLLEGTAIINVTLRRN